MNSRYSLPVVHGVNFCAPVMLVSFDAAGTPSLISAMTFSCREFAIRVSGLGDTWFRAPLPRVAAKVFAGYTEDDVELMGGESVINETVGLGGFAQAAAFALQDYQGGSAEDMMALNRAMYDITDMRQVSLA